MVPCMEKKKKKAYDTFYIVCRGSILLDFIRVHGNVVMQDTENCHGE
jgi:hypothetical protein